MVRVEYAYLITFAVSLLICILMLATTTFYSIYYPTANIVQLPNGVSTIVLSIFNGYNEYVSVNPGATPSQSQSISISALQTTSYALLLATTVIIIFDYLYRNFGLINNAGKVKSISVQVFISFFVALFASQYLESTFFFLSKNVPFSGISLFLVDSLATSILFAAATAILVLSRSLRIFILKRPRIEVKYIIMGVAFTAYWLFVELSSASTLLPLINVVLEYTSFNAIYIYSFDVHAAGLVVFFTVFSLIYAYLSYILPYSISSRK